MVFSRYKTKTSPVAGILLRSAANNILDNQLPHLKCLMDPVGVEMYTSKRMETIGTITLPVWTSLKGE